MAIGRYIIIHTQNMYNHFRSVFKICSQKRVFSPPPRWIHGIHHFQRPYVCRQVHACQGIALPVVCLTSSIARILLSLNPSALATSRCRCLPKLTLQPKRAEPSHQVNIESTLQGPLRINAIINNCVVNNVFRRNNCSVKVLDTRERSFDKYFFFSQQLIIF